MSAKCFKIKLYDIKLIEVKMRGKDFCGNWVLGFFLKCFIPMGIIYVLL